MDATEQAALVAAGEVTPGELLEAAIESIEQSNPALPARQVGLPLDWTIARTLIAEDT